MLQESAIDGSWYALWTHSHCEQQVYDQLLQKGFAALLPTVDIWSRRGGVRRLISTPMFPSYLFLRGEMDKARYLEVAKSKGFTRSARDERQVPVCTLDLESVVAATHRLSVVAWGRLGRQAGTLAGPPALIPYHSVGVKFMITLPRSVPGSAVPASS